MRISKADANDFFDHHCYFDFEALRHEMIAEWFLERGVRVE